MSEPRPSSPHRSAAGAARADGEQPGGVRRIEPDVVAGHPDLLGLGIAELPPLQVLAVEQGLPALAAREAVLPGGAGEPPGRERASQQEQLPRRTMGRLGREWVFMDVARRIG